MMRNMFLVDRYKSRVQSFKWRSGKRLSYNWYASHFSDIRRAFDQIHLFAHTHENKNINKKENFNIVTTGFVVLLFVFSLSLIYTCNER